MKKWYESLTPEKRKLRYELRAQWGKTPKGLEYARKKGKEWREKNKEHIKLRSRKRLEEHREMIVANNALRRARKLRAIPKWANKFFVSEIYDLARRRTIAFGQKMEVDHIVPLQHPLVCGLHVENNLQIITKSANSGKRNLWWPDMPTDTVLGLK